MDAQERWGRDYAARVWPGVPVEVFADRGIGAGNGAHRPEFARLRRWLADGRVAHLWTVEQSRLTRREVEWFELAAELDATGIGEVHTDRDGIVRVLDEVAGIKSVLSAAERRKMIGRVRQTLGDKAREGEPAGARPYGYVRGRKNDEKRTKTYLIVPEQAEVIREAADKVLAGWSLGAIAAEFAGRGLRAPHGGPMVANAVKRMLVAPSVAGKRVHGEQIYPGNWPAILDEATWEAVCDRLAAPRAVTRSDGRAFLVTDAIAHRARAGRRYLLSGGLIVCGVCSAPLVGADKRHYRGGKRSAPAPYYQCHPNRGGHGCVGAVVGPVERHVVDELFRELDRPEFLAAITSDEHAARRDELAAELEAVERRRDRLQQMWESGQRTDAEYDRGRDRFTASIERLRVELAAVAPPTELPDIAAVREAWDDPDALTLDERREFLRLFVRKVTLRRATPGARAFDPARVDIEYR